ncbi:MAG: M28 family peptidase [Flavobacteriales bacterium]|nr:M28 family peptidase [Flavobacteriales bacterium]MCC6937990.1 M28 family peptidase [Flavobacteriales bacterium]
MRRVVLGSIALILAASTCAQDPAIITSRARGWLDTLTSPAFHGRGYVKDGDMIASAWLAKKFEAFGLKPMKQDFFEPFQFNVNSFPDSVTVRIDGRRLVPGIDFLVDPASGKASGTYGIVHITPADLASPERKRMTMGVISGKAACVHWTTTKSADTLRLYQDWERDLMHYGPVLKSTGKLTWSVAQDAEPFPLIEVTGDALTDSSLTVDLEVRNKLLSRHPARNVMGMVKGKSKKWIVVGAHYDHLGEMGPDALFPGANDNASGTAMLLSLAEYFGQKKNTPKHNLLFVAFAGEEAGLVGSEWCVTDRPIAWKDVRMMVNLDILGTGDDGIMVVNATAQQKAYDQLVAINATKGYLKEVKARGPSCNSDHCPFVQRGVPAIFIYTLGGVAYYHDVLDRSATLPLTEFADLHALLRDFITTWK